MVHVVYGDWQMFLPTENCISRNVPCHRGWNPLPNLLPSLLPKPNLALNPQPREQPGLQLESPLPKPQLSSI